MESLRIWTAVSRAATVAVPYVLAILFLAVLGFVLLKGRARKTAFLAAQISAFGLGILLLTSLGKVFAAANFTGEQAKCRTRLKGITMAVLQYAIDNDERLPLARNWADVTAPLAVKENAPQPVHVCAETKSAYSYIYNSQCDGLSLTDPEEPTRSVLLWEGAASEPNPAAIPDKSRPSGHQLIAYFDGHIAPLRSREHFRNIPLSSSSNSS